MATTLTTSYSLSQSLFDKDIETTTEKAQRPQNQHLTSVVVPALVASLLVTPMYDIPTNATPDYSIYPHYTQTGQQNEIEFEKNITDKISAYQFYPIDWDGYEGIPASSDTVKDTLEFLEKLPFGVTEPRAGLSGDGEISLFWESDEIYIDIGFLGDGNFTFYARDGQGIEYFKDEIGLDEPLPDALLHLINIK